MKKYELKNLPKGGMKFERVGERPIILNEETSDEDCETLLNDGNNKNAAYYIHLKKEAKPEAPAAVAKPAVAKSQSAAAVAKISVVKPEAPAAVAKPAVAKP